MSINKRVVEAELSNEPKERGIWAEHYVRDFLSLPFISECVFHSLQAIDGTEKEVADFLIAYPGVGVLISQKTQKDPRFRTSGKTQSRALKEAKKAVSHIKQLADRSSVPHPGT